MEEDFELKLKRYRTPSGEPTCCLVYGEQYCKFQRTARMGTIDTCVFAPEDFSGRPISCERLDSEKKGDGLGYTIPGEWCPIWVTS